MWSYFILAFIGDLAFNSMSSMCSGCVVVESMAIALFVLVLILKLADIANLAWYVLRNGPHKMMIAASAAVRNAFFLLFIAEKKRISRK
jgi:hypothetical protein